MSEIKCQSSKYVRDFDGSMIDLPCGGIAVLSVHMRDEHGGPPIALLLCESCADECASDSGVTVLSRAMLISNDEASDWNADETVGHPDNVLGSCGCVDYHMSDCPTRSSAQPLRDPYDAYDEMI